MSRRPGHKRILAAQAAAILLLLAGPAAAQNSFPTPGGATVPGYVNMCITGNRAVPCIPSRTITSGDIIPECTAALDGLTIVVVSAPVAAILVKLLCVAGTGWRVD